MSDLIERDAALWITAETGALETQRRIKDLPSANQWISCSEKMPEPLQNVIVCTDIKTVTLAWLMGDNWYFADTGNGHIEQCGMSDVTHWMPLPKPYEPEVNNNG